MLQFRLFALLSLAISSPLALAQSNGTGPSADVLLHRAEMHAGKSGRNVLLIFHASWCGWCHKLDGMLQSPQFRPMFARNYVIVHIDVMEHGAKTSLETPSGGALQAKLGAVQDGLPYYVVYSPTGKLLATSRARSANGGAPVNIGYPSQPNEVRHFMRMLAQTAPHASRIQLQAVDAFLTSTKRSN